MTEQAIAQPPGLDLCLAEALNNAVDHGNGNDPSQRVTVTLQTRAGRMEIIIKDAAGQLEPAMLDAAEMPPPGAESGRGLALVRSLLPDSCVRDGQLVLVLPG